MAQYVGKDKRLAYLFEHGGGGGGGTEFVEMTMEEYEALPYTKLTDGVPRLITNYSEGGEGKQIYDDTERVIGTWFGEPLYRKVIKITKNISITANEWTNIYDNIGNIKIISAKFLNSTNNGYLSGIWYRPNNNNLEMYFRYNIGAVAVYNANIILEYTKVGD